MGHQVTGQREDTKFPLPHKYPLSDFFLHSECHYGGFLLDSVEEMIDNRGSDIVRDIAIYDIVSRLYDRIMEHSESSQRSGSIPVDASSYLSPEYIAYVEINIFTRESSLQELDHICVDLYETEFFWLLGDYPSRQISRTGSYLHDFIFLQRVRPDYGIEYVLVFEEILSEVFLSQRCFIFSHRFFL